MTEQLAVAAVVLCIQHVDFKYSEEFAVVIKQCELLSYAG